jgi:hypothetical protein
MDNSTQETPCWLHEVMPGKRFRLDGQEWICLQVPESASWVEMGPTSVICAQLADGMLMRLWRGRAVRRIVEIEGRDSG